MQRAKGRMGPSFAAVNKKKISLCEFLYPLSVCHIALLSVPMQDGVSILFPHLLLLWLFNDKNKLKDGEIMKIWWGLGRDRDPGILKLTWADPPLSPLPRIEWWYGLIKNALLNYEKSGRLHLGRTESDVWTVCGFGVYRHVWFCKDWLLRFRSRQQHKGLMD